MGFHEHYSPEARLDPPGPPADRLRLPVFLLTWLLASLLILGFAIPAQAMVKGLTTDLNWAAPYADQTRTQAELKNVGSKWVRFNVNWKDIERDGKGKWNYSWIVEDDQAIDRARASGQQIVVALATAPTWASGSSNTHTPPKNVQDYADFVRFVVNRWKGKVKHWQMWNEPNYVRFWPPSPNPAAYAPLLKAGYAAAKQADPYSKVLYGGLSTNDWQFLEKTYSYGVKGHFDIMAVHPYTCSKSPDTYWRYPNGRGAKSAYKSYREVRKSMVNRGDYKPIWFTEFGWSTNTQTCPTTLTKQAEYLKRAYEIAASNSYVRVGLWYNFRNNYWSKDANDWGSQFGLMRTDWSRKPAYYAFRDLP